MVCGYVVSMTGGSNFDGCSMGRSAGVAPLRILSTITAARRKRFPRRAHD
jgi:hypothetical protein